MSVNLKDKNLVNISKYKYNLLQQGYFSSKQNKLCHYTVSRHNVLEDLLTCRKPKITANGMMTANRMGIVYKIMMNVVSSGPPTKKRFNRYCCILVSMISTSLEKRLMMRPRGVVSKNDMGHWTILCSMDEWRTLDAETEPRTTIVERADIASTGKQMKW